MNILHRRVQIKVSRVMNKASDKDIYNHYCYGDKFHFLMIMMLIVINLMIIIKRYTTKSLLTSTVIIMEDLQLTSNFYYILR